MTQIFEKVLDFISVINYAYPVVAPILFVWVVLFDREKLSVQLDNVAKFLAFLTIIGFAKMCLWNGEMVKTNTHNLSLYNFLFVFLEDVFFVMLPFYLTKKIRVQYINLMIWIFFSLIFGIGHRYQGVSAIFITAIYPYFISNRYAKKTSFGTVMICHFLWDCFTITLPKVNNLLSLF